MWWPELVGSDLLCFRKHMRLLQRLLLPVSSRRCKLKLVHARRVDDFSSIPHNIPVELRDASTWFYYYQSTSSRIGNRYVFRQPFCWGHSLGQCILRL